MMQIRVVHICPENDWIDHSTDMENGLCVCRPTVEIEQGRAIMCMIIKHRRVDPECDVPVRFWSRRRVIRFAVLAVVFVVWRGLFL